MKVPKPQACDECPFRNAGEHMHTDEIVPDAPVYVQGGVAQPAPDTITETVFFPLAGLIRGENVSIGYAIRCAGDVLNKSAVREAVVHCARAHTRLPASTRLVVAQGAMPWQAWTSHSHLPIGDWRGFLAPRAPEQQLPVYAVLSVEELRKQPELTLPSKLDWARIPRVLSGELPKPFPPRLTVGEADHNDVCKWFEDAHTRAPYLLWDTEYFYDVDNSYAESNHQLTMLSITYPGADQGIQMGYTSGPAEGWQKHHFISSFEALARSKPHVGHNFPSEIRAMEKTFGWKPEWFWGRFDDSMLAHAVLWSELPHTLEFLESVCSPHPKMKHLPTTDPDRNWGDTVVTGYVWEMLRKELERDPDSMKVYREQSLALTPHIYKRESMGLRVNKARVAPAIQMYQAKIDEAERLAKAYCGFDINLGSSTQLGYWLYDVEQLKVQKSKNKHTKTARSMDKDAVASLRASVCAFDGDYEANNSVTQEYVEQRLRDGAHPLLEAKVLFGGAEQTLSHYLNPLMKEGA